MSTPLPVDNPYCLFCGEMVANPTAKSQCGNCGALACDSCQQQGNTVCTECGGKFGQSASAAPVTETPRPAPAPSTRPAPSAPPPVPPSPVSNKAAAPDTPFAAPVMPTYAPSPERSQPAPTPASPVVTTTPSSPAAARPAGGFDLEVYQNEAEGWKSQGRLISPLLGPRLVFWGLIITLSICVLAPFLMLWIATVHANAADSPSYSSPGRHTTATDASRRVGHFSARDRQCVGEFVSSFHASRCAGHFSARERSLPAPSHKETQGFA